jgi:protease-4
MRFLSTLAASTLGVLIAFGILVLVGFFFVFAVSLSADPTPQVADGTVLKVTLDGPIPERMADDPFAQALGDGPAFDLLDLRSALRKAEADDRIAAVWLDVKRPQAGWATLHDVRRALDAVRASGKLVVASAADFGYNEAGYFVATAADSIFATPLAPFEFNGFDLTATFYKGTLDKLGIEPEIVRAGKFKSAVEPFLRRDLSEPNRLQLQALLDNQNRVFMQTVAARRGLDAADLVQMAREDALLSVEEALERGLIDAMRYPGDVEAALRARAGTDEGDDLETISVSAYARVPAAEAGIEPTGDGSLAVVYAEGGIVSGESESDDFSGQTSSVGSTTLAAAMREAREDDDVKAVVLRVRSPGGSAAASEVMWDAIRTTAAQKPVIVSMGDVAASGGYYIAAGADSIVADPLTITGSIGVFGLLVNARGFFEDDLGITFDGVRTSPYADLYSGIKPLSDAERGLLEQNIDTVYQTFMQRVADARGLPVDSVDAIAQGRVWAGADAREVGLVDQLGGLGDALQIAGRRGGLGEGPYRVRILPKPKTFFERLGESFGGSSAALWTRLTASDLERHVARQQAALRRAARDHGTAQMRLPTDLTIE